MSSIIFHSVQPLSGTKPHYGWRIASAVVPVAVARFEVTREESRDLTPARLLLLETLQFLEEENECASLRDLATLSGIQDEALMAGIVVPLREQGLISVEGEMLRRNPSLTVEGKDARIVIQREERVCVIGSPPVPAHGVDRNRLQQLRAFDGDSSQIVTDHEMLESWRTAFWDEQTLRVESQEPLIQRFYVLESSGSANDEVILRDDRQSLRTRLPSEHPFLWQLEAQARPILDSISRLLSPFGVWNHAGELRCDGEQWRHWRAIGGHEGSEVILRGAIDIAVSVRCRPSDGNAAYAMLLENVIAELCAKPGSCTTDRLEDLSARQRQSPLLRDFEIPTPTLAEVETAAWESGRWELAYRIAAPADGL